jgi:hypothetical protein
VLVLVVAVVLVLVVVVVAFRGDDGETTARTIVALNTNQGFPW